jgi:hypothetical protein
MTAGEFTTARDCASLTPAAFNPASSCFPPREPYQFSLATMPVCSLDVLNYLMSI